MESHHQPVILPDLGLGDDVPLLISVWHTNEGSQVIQGDRLLEIHAGVATVDLPAPASGVLAKRLVAEDDPVRPGQVLGIIRRKENDHFA